MKRLLTLIFTFGFCAVALAQDLNPNIGDVWTYFGPTLGSGWGAPSGGGSPIIYPITVPNGGTGAITAGGAINNLGAMNNTASNAVLPDALNNLGTMGRDASNAILPSALTNLGGMRTDGANAILPDAFNNIGAMGKDAANAILPDAFNNIGAMGKTGSNATSPTARNNILQYVDSFFLAGDPDDTLSFQRARDAGVQIRLGPRTYLVKEFATGAIASWVMVGERGRSIIQRVAGGVTSSFFRMQAASVYVDGVIFDSNKAAISANQWGVILDAGGQTVTIRNSVFKNNSGALGSCLALLATGPAAGGSFMLDNIEVSGCTFNPIYLASVSNGVVHNAYVHDNSFGGIFVMPNGTASGTNYATNIRISNSKFINNTGGAQVEFDAFAVPYTFGTPGATYSDVVNSYFSGGSSTSYQLGIFGDYNSAIGNSFRATTSVFGAIDCNSRYSQIKLNTITLASGASYGIDCGGAVSQTVQANHITMSSGTAIDAGGNQDGLYSGNVLDLSGTALGFLVYEVEGDGAGNAFPTISSGTIIQDNALNMVGSGTGSIGLYDNPGGRSGGKPTIVRRNNLNLSSGALAAFTWFGNAQSLYIDANTVSGGNNTFIDPNGSGDIIFNPIFFGGLIQGISSTSDIRAIVPKYVNDFGTGSVLYVTPTAGGSGYTTSTVLSASGGGGSGWTGFALVRSGAIIGVRTLTNGSGYTSDPTISATIGSGATFSVSRTPELPKFAEITYISAVTPHILQSSGGATTINGADPMTLMGGTTLKLKAGASGLAWSVLATPAPAQFTVAGLPTCNAANTGARAVVTNGAGGKWWARCNGTVWKWADGSNV